MAPLGAVKSGTGIDSGEGLPLQLTSFIGRGAELAELRELLGHSRLVTLTGSAGSGKTRLALQLAVETRLDHPDGAWFVPLADVSDPGRVVAAAASVMGLHEEVDRSLADSVLDYLRSRRSLLVLDNCEHILDGCAGVALSLLRTCPHIRVLATSREPLRLSGELVWPVPALSLPPLEPEPQGQASPASEAALLFAERGALVRPWFRVTDANAASVFRVCRRLDGMPLAIELAAARLHILTVEQIEARLERRFHLLTRGSSGSVPRHQTLHAAVDWSFDLLTPPERALFARLSVFAGGFTLETAEALCGGGDIAAEDVLDLVTGLVEKSMVVAEHTGSGESRFRLLETMREYGRERLVARGEWESLRQAHAAFFLEAAVASEANLTGPDQAGCLRWLRSEQADLGAALEWWRVHDPVEGLRMAAALGMFWYMQGLLTEGSEQILASLDRGHADSVHRAAALHAVGLLEHRHADYEAAKGHFDAAEALFQAAGDARGVGRCVMRSAKVVLELGDFQEARRRLEQALAILRAAGDEWAVAQTLHDLGLVHGVHVLHDPARSIPYFREALRMRRELRDRHAAAFTLFAMSFERAGGFASRKEMALEALEIYQQVDDPVGVGVIIDVCAALAADSRQPRRAITLHAAASAHRARIRGAVPARLRMGVEHQVLHAASSLPPSEVSRCEAEGLAMSLDDILALVVGAWGPEPEGPSERPDGTLRLSRRETEVARLVAEGLSNRLIADRLCISPRTAEYHVEQICNKLGFRSRAQVAAWSVEHDASRTRNR